MTRLFLIGVAAVAMSGAAAQTTTSPNDTGAAGTNGAMESNSTGTIGTLSSSSTEPSAGGSAPAGNGPTGAVSNDTTNGSVGTAPATSGKPAKKQKSHSTSKTPE